MYCADIQDVLTQQMHSCYSESCKFVRELTNELDSIFHPQQKRGGERERGVERVIVKVYLIQIHKKNQFSAIKKLS